MGSREAGQADPDGHTRMQRARPITVAEKIGHWREPLARHRERLVELAPRLFLLQFGGAVGNRASLAQGAAVPSAWRRRCGCTIRSRRGIPNATALRNSPAGCR